MRKPARNQKTLKTIDGITYTHRYGFYRDIEAIQAAKELNELNENTIAIRTGLGYDRGDLFEWVYFTTKNPRAIRLDQSEPQT